MKVAYKFKTSEKLKRIHKTMLNRLGIKRARHQRGTFYFSIEESEEERVKNFLQERGVEIERTKK